MNSLLLRTLLVAGLVVAATSVATSVSRAGEQSRWWLSTGAGGGYAQSGSGAGLAIALSLQPGKWVFSGRTAVVGDWWSGSGRGDVALLAGLGTRKDTYHASFGIGVGRAGNGLNQSEVALQGQWMTVGGTLGLGVYAFAGFSSDNHFAGGALTLSFGHLR